MPTYKTLDLSFVPFGLRENWSTDGEIVSSFGGGYSNSLVIGEKAGLKSWNLSFNAFTHQNVTADGITQSQLLYIYNIFREQKMTGEPIKITSPVNGQTYLARFAEKEISLEKFTYRAWRTGLKLVQARVEGVSVYNPLLLAPYAWYDASQETSYTNGANATQINDYSGNARHLTIITGTNYPTYQTGVVNSQPVFRWNGSSNRGMKVTGLTLNLRHVFVVAKYSGGSTFPNAGTDADYKGLVSESRASGSGGLNLLTGKRNSALFVDNNYNATYTVEYRKNGVLPTSPYEENMGAPMGSFAASELSITNGGYLALTTLMLGEDREFTTRLWNGDIAEVLIFNTELPLADRMEMAEHLMAKYDAH